MRRFPLFAGFVLVLSGGCGARPAGPVPPQPDATAPRTIRVGITDGAGGTVRELPFEDYVTVTVLSELVPMPGDAASAGRMLEVQAIVNRTYATSRVGRHAREGFDVCSTTHCQLFDAARLQTSSWAEAARAASRRTRGAMLWFEGRPITAVYHADCGGHTSAASAVWDGEDRPYLTARADDGAAEAAHAAWRFEAPRDAVARALNADARTRVGARLDRLSVLNRDAAGRATRVAVAGDQPREVRGEHVREVLTRAFGVRSIRSTWFHIKDDRSTIVFEGRGFGHGVGLCQAGARARLRAGADVHAVLERYYPGTRLWTGSPSRLGRTFPAYQNRGIIPPVYNQ